jgi:hypothetical protein
MAYWRNGDKKRAGKTYNRAVRWMDEHHPHDQRLRRFRAEAAVLLCVTELPDDVFGRP